MLKKENKLVKKNSRTGKEVTQSLSFNKSKYTVLNIWFLFPAVSQCIRKLISFHIFFTAKKE
jgi:hypothetical protein